MVYSIDGPSANFWLAIMLNAWYFQVRNPQASFKDVFHFNLLWMRKCMSAANVFTILMFAICF